MIEQSESRFYEKVKSILADALEVDPHTIHPQTLIISDLGAESIDLLDITFRLEKAFRIHIPEKYLSTKSERIPEGKTAAEILSVQLLVDFVDELVHEAGIRDLP